MSDQSVGAGFFTIADANDEFSVTAFIVRQMIKRLDVMKLVQVTAVHGGGIAMPPTVDAQLLVSQLDGNGNKVDNGVVYGLPCFRNQAGPWAIVADPVVGDIGWVVCSDRDISNVKAAALSGGNPQTTPGSRRNYSVSDGVYVGGCLNAAPTGYLWLKSDGTFQMVDAKGNSIVTAATGMTLADLFGNEIQMKTGVVNIVTLSFEVNGVPVTVP